MTYPYKYVLKISSDTDYVTTVSEVFASDLHDVNRIYEDHKKKGHVVCLYRIIQHDNCK